MVARDAVRITSQVQVEASGSELSAADLARITRVEIESSMHLPDTATIEFLDSDYALIEESAWEIGKPLKVLMGDSEALVPIFEGEITHLEVSYDPDGLGSVTIRGYDKSHRLHRGRKSVVFLEKKDSAIVAEIARSNGLSAEVTNTATTHKYVLQDNQTDWEFITERARRNGMHVWISENKLHMAPPPDSGSPVELSMGDQLRSLRVRLSATGQVAKVEVPACSVEAVTFLRAEVKVLRRRVENMKKAIGDSSRPAS